jgi:hypothetical protein
VIKITEKFIFGASDAVEPTKKDRDQAAILLLKGLSGVHEP